MKKLLMVCIALGVLAGMTSLSVAAEPQKDVSNATLASVGLGGMQTMSDQEGMAVRGKGRSLAFGGGWATLLLPSSFNVYFSSHKTLAGGANFSSASLGPILAISGGFSIAGGF